MSDPQCRSAHADDGHLFTCPACRGEARLAQAWKGLPRPETDEVLVDPDLRFVTVVLRSVRNDRARRVRVRVALAAAAALLFFFFAGTGHEAAAPSETTDGFYASLVTPSALEGLIPN